MNNTILEITNKPTWLKSGNHDMDCYNVTMIKNAYELIDKLEYKKIALLNHKNDLINKLNICTNDILEIDYEMKTINLELMERMKNDRR